MKKIVSILTLIFLHQIVFAQVPSHIFRNKDAFMEISSLKQTDTRSIS